MPAFLKLSAETVSTSFLVDKEKKELKPVNELPSWCLSQLCANSNQSSLFNPPK